MGDDELAQRFILEDFDGAVDVGMLVDQGVACRVVDELDAGRQGFLAFGQSLHAVSPSHFLATQNRIDKGVIGDRVRHRVGYPREAGERRAFRADGVGHA